MDHAAGGSRSGRFIGRENPIHAWLDDVGIPWKASRGELATRYGITRQPHRFNEAVEIDLPRAPLEGLIRPICIQLSENFTPRLPASEFFGDVWFVPDERTNLRRTAAQFATVLGETPIGDYLNTVRAVWTFGRARVELLAWPADMQSHRPTDRDPRLVSRCHISIKTGFLLPPSAEELHGLNTFVAVGAIPIPPCIDSVGASGPGENVLEFVRDPQGVDGIEGAIGISADGKSLIFQNVQLFVISSKSIVKIRVERIQPARGPGGSHMQVECRTDYDGPRSKMVTVCSAQGPDDLNALGAAISAAINRPLDLGAYESDC
jgi:hypothetical protein